MEELNAPIPGQSLTTEPKGQAYERPPQTADPEEALLMHLDNLEQPEAMKGVADLLEIGMDIQTITTGILRNGVAAGRHNVDISMIIGPIIHEHIKGIAETLDIEYNDGFEDEEEGKIGTETKKSMLAERELERLRQEQRVDAPTEQEAIQVSEQQEKPKRGLMQRRR